MQLNDILAYLHFTSAAAQNYHAAMSRLTALDAKPQLTVEDAAEIRSHLDSLRANLDAAIDVRVQGGRIQVAPSAAVPTHSGGNDIVLPPPAEAKTVQPLGLPTGKAIPPVSSTPPKPTRPPGH